MLELKSDESSPVRDRYGLLAWLIPVFATLVLWFIQPPTFGPVPLTDYWSFYEPVARVVAAGQGFHEPDGTPATRYPPGYPLLIAMAFKAASALNLRDESGIAMLTLVSVGAAGAGIFALASQVWRRPLSLLPVVAWTLYPPALWLTRRASVELPFIAIFIWAVVVVWRAVARRDHRLTPYLAGGALIGAAMLIRPIVIGMGVCFAAVVYVALASMPTARRILVATSLLAANVVTVLPWEITMVRSTGHAYPLSSNGPASMVDGLTFAVDTSKAYRAGIDMPDDVELLMHDVLRQRFLSAGDVARFLVREAGERPAAVVKLLGIKLARAWYGTDSQRRESPLIILQLVVAIAALTATLGAWRLGGSARALALVAWGIVGYFWGMTLLVLPIARYLVPAMPFLFAMFPALLVFARRPSERPD